MARALPTDARAELRLSEIFESVQGEGVSVGLPSIFLRLASCNLRCTWCDTKYAWDWSSFDKSAETELVGVSELAARLRGYRSRNIVVTGGEPMLQQRELAPLLAELREFRVEIETAGTLAPTPAMLERVEQWNVSPKLASSGNALDKSVKRDALSVLASCPEAWFKMVVGDEADALEALALTDSLGVPRERVLFMPLGATPEQYAESGPRVAELCTEHEVRLSPRTHVVFFRGARGR